MTPGTMLGLAARENRRAMQEAQPRPARDRLRRIVRVLLATIALAIGLNGLSMASAQAFPWDDMKENIAATMVNMCGPNDVPDQVTYTNLDTMAGLNQAKPSEGYRATIKPDFSQDKNGTQGGNGMERLQRVYGGSGDVIVKPTYERYGFSPLQWHQYGYDCFSPTLMMGPLANMGLMAMVHVPMMISMAILNFVMSTALWDGFAELMQPFIGAMYGIFNPWVYFIVPLGVGITWLGSRGSLQATLRAAGWGVMILAVYMFMGSSTSPIVKGATNFVTEVTGTAACKMAAAADGSLNPDLSPDPPPENAKRVEVEGPQCDTDDPIKAVQQALWYGIPYRTWHLGQVGEHQAELDESAYRDGRVGWGPAILNGQYVGVDESGNVDEAGQQVLASTDQWNRASYSPDGDGTKGYHWTTGNAWNEIPYIATIKIMCNDVGGLNDERSTEPSDTTRWMYSGNDGSGNYCDAAGAGTSTMIPHIQGDAYSKQFLVALSGMIGVGAVSLTIVASSIYLGFQKMMFFFLLFLAPIVLLVSAIGDRKRRPFAIRYAEIVGANLLKQIAAVCIVLFVSYALASLFGSGTFASVPWIMKPYVALLFFVALAFLAFPLKNMIQGAIKGDVSSLDKQATAPQRALKTGAKVAAVTGAIAATGGAAAALGASGAGATALAGLGGKGAALGKVGSMLGQAGRVIGGGSRIGRAMRVGGQLLKAGEGVMKARDTRAGAENGKRIGIASAADSLLASAEPGGKYRDKSGKLLPGAQEMAVEDAKRMGERGEQTPAQKREKRVQDQFMSAFFEGYRAEHGQFHRDDPASPDAQRTARVRHRPEHRQSGTDADAVGKSRQGLSAQSKCDSGPDDGEGPTPSVSSPADPGSGPSGGGAARSGPRPDYAQFADTAKENLSGPAFSREMEYSVNTVRSGDDVLSNAGLTKEQVAQDPTTLLRSDAYEGGATTKMDPFHPATASLNELRFASSSGDEDAIEKAVAKAVDSVSQHGVPSQIDGVHSIGDRSSSFEPVQLLGAMPQLSENTSWQERADAAHTMMAAQVAMPQDFAARQSVEDYTSALANPGVDVASLSAIKETAVNGIAGQMVASLGETGASVMTAGTADASPLQVEALRDALSDGLREVHAEQDTTGTSASDPRDTSLPSNDAEAGTALTDPVEQRSTPSTALGRPSANPAPTDADPSTDDDDAALVYRPGREKRKKRSGFFDHDDQTTDDEEDSP